MESSLSLEEKSVMYLAIESDLASAWTPEISPERSIFREDHRNPMSPKSRSPKRLNVGSLHGHSYDSGFSLLKNRSMAVLMRTRARNLPGKVRALHSKDLSEAPRVVSVLYTDAREVPKQRKSMLEQSVVDSRIRQTEKSAKLIRPTIRIKKKESESSFLLPKLCRNTQPLGHAASPRQILALRRLRHHA